MAYNLVIDCNLFDVGNNVEDKSHTDTTVFIILIKACN